MKAGATINEAFGSCCEVSIHFSCGSVSVAEEIAQRFNAGFQLRNSPKSLQGRQNRGCLFALLSSLGLRNFDRMTFPALKRWAIFGSTDGWERVSLRLAS